MWQCFLPFWCIFSQISQTIKLAKKWCAEDVEAQRSKLTSHGLSLWLLSRWRWGCWPLGRRGGEWLGRWLRQHGLHHFQLITSHSHSWLRQHGQRQKGKKASNNFSKVKRSTPMVSWILSWGKPSFESGRNMIYLINGETVREPEENQLFFDVISAPVLIYWAAVYTDAYDLK